MRRTTKRRYMDRVEKRLGLGAESAAVLAVETHQRLLEAEVRMEALREKLANANRRANGLNRMLQAVAQESAVQQGRDSRRINELESDLEHHRAVIANLRRVNETMQQDNTRQAAMIGERDSTIASLRAKLPPSQSSQPDQSAPTPNRYARYALCTCKHARLSHPEYGEERVRKDGDPNCVMKVWDSELRGLFPCPCQGFTLQYPELKLRDVELDNGERANTTNVVPSRLAGMTGAVAYARPTEAQKYLDSVSDSASAAGDEAPAEDVPFSLEDLGTAQPQPTTTGANAIS